MPIPTAIALLSDCAVVPAAVVEKWVARMPDHERDRIAAFSSPQRIQQFVCARQLLKELLHHPMGLEGAICVDAQGAPYITNGRVSAYCSISHSGSAVMVACSVAGKIGVDIERLRVRDYSRLAREYFHAAEVAQLRQSSASERQRRFYNTWCLKEAQAKATGEGLRLRHLKREFCCGVGQTATSWELPGYSAAVVYSDKYKPELFVAGGVGSAGKLLLHPAPANFNQCWLSP